MGRERREEKEKEAVGWELFKNENPHFGEWWEKLNGSLGHHGCEAQLESCSISVSSCILYLVVFQSSVDVDSSAPNAPLKLNLGVLSQPRAAQPAQGHESQPRAPAKHQGDSPSLKNDFISAKRNLRGLQDPILMPSWTPPSHKSL